jgi:hypothetical protein
MFLSKTREWVELANASEEQEKRLKHLMTVIGCAGSGKSVSINTLVGCIGNMFNNNNSVFVTVKLYIENSKWTQKEVKVINLVKLQKKKN